MLLKLTAVLVSGLLVASCATTTGTGGTDVCAVWPAVSWSVKDTDKTIEDAKISNARRAAWCR